MSENNEASVRKLAEFRPPVKLKLSALWTSLMFLYVYGDYFNMYQPGKIAAMGEGRIGPFGAASDAVFIALSAMMAIPALMIALSLLLPPLASRWSNVVFGLFYSAIIALTMKGSAPFYQAFGVVEIIITLSIAWTALRWPKIEIEPSGSTPYRSAMAQQ